jgi:hypothetical protein
MAMAIPTQVFVCWPEYWREAAIYAGLAERAEYGGKFASDEMRDRLAVFAEQILLNQPGPDE